MDGQVFTVLLAISSVILPTNSAPRKQHIDIYSVHVDCQVSSRFAHTVITSKVVNRANVSKEAFFEVELPKTAFITNYSMTIDGVVYPGTIKEKEEAQKQYDFAVSQGQSASLVKTTGRKMENFEVSVNIEAAGKIVFELIYEELLKRQLGKYELLIKVKPKQLVKHFQIDVRIFEPQGISFVDTSSTFMTNELFEAITKTVNETKAHVSFKPTIDQQRKSPNGKESLIDGDLTISYDVKRSGMAANDLQIVNGYFVHYFAPPNLPKLPKNVVFVIDQSGSMTGRKIQQTREALIKILDDINPEDHFNFIVFHSEIYTWKKTLFPATEQNVNSAKDYVRQIHAFGATNINEALLTAVRMLTKANEDGKLSERSVSMIILLTDGDPTTGVTNIEEIQENIKSAIKKRYSLYCLGFGFDVDYSFLEKMALQNGGVARRIYEDSDSALQLQGFYQEIANPTLMKIELQYPENAVSELTTNNFGQFFDGSEIVVAGHITNDKLDIFTAEIKAKMHVSDLVLQVEANVTEKEDMFKHLQYVFGSFIERLWAYLSIQQLLEKLVMAKGEEKTSLKAQTLQLSLKYGFVTPLTSMVVTKPGDQEQLLSANKPVKKVGPPSYPVRPPSHPGVSLNIQRVNKQVKKDGLPGLPGVSLNIQQKNTRRKGVSHRYPDYDLLLHSPPDSHLAEADHFPSFDPPEVLDHFPDFLLTREDEVDLDLFPDPHPTEVERTTTPPMPTMPWIYGDDYPHFIFQLPNQNDSFCVDISGQPPIPLNLVSDADTGIWVDGMLRSTAEQTMNFVVFAITYKNPEVNVSVTASIISLWNTTVTYHVPWDKPDSLTWKSLKISIEAKRSLTISADDKATIIISYIDVFKPFLQLSIVNGHHFSASVDGFIGKFYSNTHLELNQSPDPSDDQAVLNVQGEKLTVTRGLRKNYNQALLPDAQIFCWSISLKGN